jgi:anti-sigma factor RsiW
MILSTQHLSDEAVAACADGVLGATATGRALRHLATCPECAQAVAAQREAVDALRTAPLPSLPTGLLDRLRAVPVTTSLSQPDVAIGPDGSTHFRTTPLGAFPSNPNTAPMAAALAAPVAGRRHLGFGALTAALVLAAGTAATGATVGLTEHSVPAAPAVPANIAPTLLVHDGGTVMSATFAGLTVR